MYSVVVINGSAQSVSYMLGLPSDIANEQPLLVLGDPYPCHERVLVLTLMKEGDRNKS